MNRKTHVILVALLLLLILIAAHLAQRLDRSSPAPQGPIVIDETRFIHIIRAHWGRNCHGQKRQASPAVAMGISEQGAYEAPLYEVAENNAYKPVAETCDRQRYCELEAKTEFLGFDPAPNCRKELTVEYRCFSYDTPWVKKAAQNQDLRIDCQAGHE